MVPQEAPSSASHAGLGRTVCSKYSGPRNQTPGPLGISLSLRLIDILRRHLENPKDSWSRQQGRQREARCFTLSRRRTAKTPKDGEGGVHSFQAGGLEGQDDRKPASRGKALGAKPSPASTLSFVLMIVSHFYTLLLTQNASPELAHPVLPRLHC